MGAEVYNMMAEADQAMTEASEIIAEIASLTERVPSHIRCNELLEACASAQAEIKSVDFLSYGQKVNQGLQNLLDHNQYITEHFIKNMGMHTEKMRGLGEEFKRLSELITYSGESMPLKGIAFSAVSNTETTNTDGEDENPPKYSTDDLMCGGAAEVLEVSAEELENLNPDVLLANASIETFELKLQFYDHYNVGTYEELCNYLGRLLSKHYITQLEYEELKGYIPNLRNTPSDVENICRNYIYEILTNRKELINSIDNKIEEAYNNMSLNNSRAIVEYQLLNEYRDELLDGIMTIEKIEGVIDIIERKNPKTFTYIGVLYIYDSSEYDRLMQKIVEPYIESYNFAIEHVSVELLNQLDWAYVNEEHVSELRLVMVKYDITTVERLRHFLAQCDVESGISKDLLEFGHGEGCDYFPYYGAGRIQLTGAAWYYGFATYMALERYPQLGDKVTYCNPAHRDFDNYIYPQYENLIKAAEEEGLDISEFMKIVDGENGPIYVAENYAWESAGYFWYMNECNEVVDSYANTENNADAITSRVNGDASERHFEQKTEAYEKIAEYVN